MDKKGILLMFLIFVFSLSFIHFASATSIKYEPNEKGIEDMVVSIKDTIFFGLIKTGEQGTMELKSHKTPTEILKVEQGQQVVMYYDFDFKDKYDNALGKVYFIDKKTGKEVEREYKFVYPEYTYWEFPIYKEVCPKFKEEEINEDYSIERWKEDNCKKEIDYIDKSQQRVIWKDYNSNDIQKGKFTIGIMVNVNKNDYIDAIWEVQGEKIERHAYYIEGIAEYIYIGGSANTIIKYDKDFNIIAVSNNYGGVIYSIAVDDDYVYYGGATKQTIIKAFKSNLTNITESLNYGAIIRSIAVDDDYIYYGGDGDFIRKAFKSNLTNITDSLSYGADINDIAIDDDYIYYGGDVDFIRKAFKSNLTNITNGIGYGGHIDDVRIDEDYVYYGGAVKQTITKAFKSNLTNITETNKYGNNIFSLDIDEDYAYYGGAGGMNINKVFKSNLTNIINSSSYGGIINSIAVDDDYIYYGGATTRKIFKAFKNNFTIISNDTNYGADIQIIELESKEKPTITLLYPNNYFNTTNGLINFTSLITYKLSLTNVSLYLDGVINETNTSGVNGTYEFTKTLSEGEHYWSILAYDIDSNPTQSGDRYFTIDYTNPLVNIINPLNTTYYTTYATTNNVSHTYNWTSLDLHLDKCWWSLDDGVTNNTVTCNSNYSFFYPFGQQTFIAWANDSMGNLGADKVTANWNFMLYELSKYYNSSSVISANEKFILSINKSSNILTQNATFTYNGVSYPVVTTTSENLVNFTSTLNIPASAGVNNSFNWTIGFTNSTGVFFYSTTLSYQSVTNITIAKCSTTAGSDFALNFSTYDATNMTALNTTFEMNFYFYDYAGDGSIVGEFLYTDTSENYSNFLFCMNSSNRNITANAVVSYGAENYDERQYYITNGTISQTVQNISLYLTETDLTDIVTIKLQDQGYVGISGAYISIQEWNIGTNTYSTIGMCQTSSVGECVMDLELYTTFYRAVVYYEGSIVEITDTQKLSSTSWIITITLEEENPYDLFNNIATSLTFSNITNITTYTWVDTSGYSQRGCLVVKNYTTTGQEIIYNSCTESVSGSIDYLISEDGSYYVYGYIYLSEYGTYKIVEYLEIQLGTLEINRITSPYGKVISFFIIGTLGMIGVAAGSALLGSVLVIIGLILSWKIGFLNITVGFIWSMVVIALLIIVLQNRRQQ